MRHLEGKIALVTGVKGADTYDTTAFSNPRSRRV